MAKPRSALLVALLPIGLSAFGCDFAQYSPPPDLTFQPIPVDLVTPPPPADMAVAQSPPDMAMAPADQATTTDAPPPAGDMARAVDGATD